MRDDGIWEDRYGDGDPARVVIGSTLRLAPVFEAEVFFRDGYWRATLDGEPLAGSPTIDQAKARVDWEIWNRLRQIRESYARVLARRSSWETGWQ